MNKVLDKYGWSTSWEEAWKSSGIGVPPRVPARVIADHGQLQRLLTESGECWGKVSGRMRHESAESGELPAVGDWVAITGEPGEEAVIHGILPRRSRVSRQAAGPVTKEQLIAANVDHLLIVAALNHDFNLRRLERYLIMAWNGGVNPVIILSKSDLCDNVHEQVAKVESIAPGIEVIALSAVTDQGKEQLDRLLQPGKTVALTGSSGSGKSTMVNWIMGKEVQLTQQVREADSRGRHTTTHREMFVLQQGAVLIDTPGMRELHLWDEGESGLSQAFSEIEQLAAGCRFQDCSHTRETGCAVKEAVQSGVLDSKRLDNYLKMQRELMYQQRKEETAAKRRASGKSSSSRKPKHALRANDWD
ncbi:MULTISPECIES: ribosome small subunit-dependent GTPase A [unclassified Paenibacillus]|uniref:ribosome small subunit-dependent GTPase A n=1 Tax=unclassified Paenibacillus TaxID=185978 RepID=UPI001F3E1E2B|nr:ribosome small subunit-dependent GTPase A [Paenibacillus sp. JJ-223]CAH1211270.1 Small ribosomal subunit biogenesis GTPase RsgA [Paenibacillus sp. JJ-223]